MAIGLRHLKAFSSGSWKVAMVPRTDVSQTKMYQAASIESWPGIHHSASNERNI